MSDRSVQSTSSSGTQRRGAGQSIHRPNQRHGEVAAVVTTQILIHQYWSFSRASRGEHDQTAMSPPASWGERARIFPPQSSHTSRRNRPLGVQPASMRRLPPRRAACCASREGQTKSEGRCPRYT
jgi:hypothetical protein